MTMTSPQSPGLRPDEWTAGPWWVDDRRLIHPSIGRNGAGLQVSAAHRGPGSAYCVASINWFDSPEANAHLIAAAPTMAEALQSIADYSVFNQMRYAEDTDTDYFLRCFKAVKDVARAALASAVSHG